MFQLRQASGGTLQGSVLVSRKSSSTPSLSETVEPKLTVASTDQVASAENLTSSSSSEPVRSAFVLHTRSAKFVVSFTKFSRGVWACLDTMNDDASATVTSEPFGD